MGRRPIELGSSPGCFGALVEQEHFGEVVAQARPSLLVGARDRPRSAGCDGGRLGQLRNGRVQSIADDVVTAGRVVLQSAPEEIREVGDVDRGPVLMSRAEHDQVAGVVTGRAEQQPGNASTAVAVRHTGGDDDSPHVARIESSPSDRLLPGDHRRRIDRGLLGDRGVGPVDPRTRDVEVGLAGAVECLDRRIDHRRVQVRAGLVAGAGGVDCPVRIAQQAHDRRPVVEVDHDRRCAFRRDGLASASSRTSAVTSWPWSCNSASTWDPMKPVAPVSATFMVGSSLRVLRRY